MKAYEILYIIKANLSEDKRKKTNEDFKSWITKTGGEITLYEEHGLKDLATEFSKMRKGYYVQCQFNADNKVLDEVNNKLRISETIFRHLIVTLDSIEEPSQSSSASKETEKTEETSESAA